MTNTSNFKLPDDVQSNFETLIESLPLLWKRHFNETWSTVVEVRSAYARMTMRRKSDGFSFRIAVADKCTACIAWPTLGKRSMSAADWNVLPADRPEPTAIVNLQYNPRVIAKHIRTYIIEPGTPLFRQALERCDEMQNRPSPVTLAAQKIAKTLNTTSIPTADQTERSIHLYFGKDKPSVSFRVSASGVDLNMRLPGFEQAAKLARTIRDLTKDQS